jgi:hypothetical protein
VTFAGAGGLANVTVLDTTALDLQALTLTGNLSVTAAGVTQSGALIVPGTTSLSAGAANDITLGGANNFVGAVSVVSGNNVTLNDGGALVLGTSTISGNLAVTAAGAISQTGALGVTGTTSITAGANTVTLTDAANDFTGSVSVVSASDLTLNDVNALVLGASSVSGTATLTAGGAISQTGTLSATTLTGSAASAVFDQANAMTNLGTFTTTGVFTLLDSAGGLTINGDVQSAGGAVTITAAGANSLLTNSANIASTTSVELNADRMSLGGKIATTVAGTGKVPIVTLRPTTAGQLISLGGADAAGTLGLTAAELNAAHATNLRVGRVDAGAITVDAAVAIVNSDNLHLITGSSITGTVFGITVDGLVLEAASTTIANPSMNVTTLAGRVTQAGNPFIYSTFDASGATVGTIDGIAGIATNNGNVFLTTTGGTLTLDQPIVAGSATVELNAGSIVSNGTTGAVVASALRTLTSGSTSLTSSSNNVSAYAAQATGAGSSITYVDSDVFTIGSVSGLNGIVTNDGSVTLTGGAVHLASPIAAGAGTVTLNMPSGPITQNAAASITADTLTGTAQSASLDANNAIAKLGPFTTNGNFTLNDGNGGLTLTGPVSASSGGAVSITTAGGTLALGATDISGQSVTLTGAGVTQSAGGTVNATIGTILIDGNDGAMNLLGALATGGRVEIIDASTVALPTITAGSANFVVLGLPGGDNLSGAVTQNAGTVISGGTLVGTTGGTVVLGNNNMLTNLGPFATNGAFSLVDVGGLSVISAVTTQNNGVASITTSGLLSISSGGSVSGAGVNLTTTSGGAMAFSGAINGNAGDVALNSAGHISQTSAGLINTTAALTGSAGTSALLDQANTLANLGPFTTVGNFTLNDATGGLTLTGAVNAGPGAVSITTAGGTLALQSNLVHGIAGVTLQGVGVSSTGGAITTGAAANSGTPSGAVQVTATGAGAIELGGNINTSGADSSGAAASAGGNVTLTTANGPITVATVNAGGGDGTGGNASGGNAGTIAFSVGGANTLTLNGNLVFRGGDAAGSGAGGFGSALMILAPTRLGGDVSVIARRGTGAGAATGGQVDFSNTIEAAAANSLSVTTDGTTIFRGAVGGNGNPLGSLTTDALGTTSISGGAVTTVGSQLYFDDFVAGAAATVLTSTGGSAITFGKTLIGSSNVLVTTAGVTTFMGAVGAAAPLTSLSTDGGGTTVINGGLVRTTGAQTYRDDVTLGAADTLLISTVNQPINFARAVDGASNLTVTTSGLTTFTGAVGAVTALTSINANGGGITAIDGSGVVTTGPQTYTDAVTLGAANTALMSTGNGAIRFASTADGASNLTVATGGLTTFVDAVGGSTALTSLTTDGAGTTALDGGTVTTSGAQTYNDAVVLGANAVVTSTGGGAIAFGSTVDGAASLMVNTAGTTTFAAAVGGTTPLTALVTDAGGATAISGATVTTSGSQTYGDTVTLAADDTFTSSGGSIVFNDVDADAAANNRALIVNAPAGSATFSGNIGAAQPLADLDVTAASIVFSAGAPQSMNVNAQGGNTVTFAGPLTLGQNLTFNTDGGVAANNFLFSGTVNADAFANNRALTLATGAGTATFANGVGNAQELGALTVSGNQLVMTGDIRLNGGGAVDFTNLANMSVTPGALIDTDRTGDATAGGSILFGATTRVNPTALNATWTLDASADGGAGAGNVQLGVIGDTTGLNVLNVIGNTVTFAGPVNARQVFVTANRVETSGDGRIFATQEFENDSDETNAALSLRGLTSEGTFGDRSSPIQIDVPGLLVVFPNSPNTLSPVFLAGDPDKKPVYKFAEDPSARLVFYNGTAPDSPASRAALGAITQQLRQLLDEINQAGFAKENIRRQLLQGLILETGLSRPGIDQFVGEGVTGPENCNTIVTAGGTLACQ